MINAKGWRQLSRGCRFQSPGSMGDILNAWHRRILCASFIALYSFAALAKPLPVCGLAAGVMTATKPTSNLCSFGNASSVTQSGSNWVWTCRTSRATASCSAPLPQPPSPSLILSVTPMAPSIPQTTALGAVVAVVTASWSDGSPFTGTISFAGPKYDDGGTFALSGNQLIINPAGLGVNGDGGTVQYVNLVATQ
jgi:hypothetical protein